MARLFWLLVTLAIVGAVLAGVSWLAAYTAVAKFLGTPPPEMGKTTTTFLWDGVPKVRDHPRAWRFAFGPTLIAGAPRAQIFVSPTGQILRTDPADLAARIKVFRTPPY